MSSFNSKSNTKTRFFHRGFTLIELMVAISIFVFMTAIIMAKYNSFYSGTIFNNLAYDVALTIRQAQTYGISVKVDISDDSTGSFDKAYGVHFNQVPAPDYSNVFLLYSYDKNLPVYSLKNQEKKYTLKQGAKFKQFCVGSDSSCSISFSAGDILDIVFQRPNPEAIICRTTGGTMSCGYKFARITLMAVDGATTKTVEVNSVGQISVK